MARATSESLLPTADAEALAGLRAGAFAERKSRGQSVPPVIKFGHRTHRYRRAAVLAWIAELEQAGEQVSAAGLLAA
jgi:hypothetical protein